jgi:hypothetical protein
VNVLWQDAGAGEGRGDMQAGRHSKPKETASWSEHEPRVLALASHCAPFSCPAPSRPSSLCSLYSLCQPPMSRSPQLLQAADCKMQMRDPPHGDMARSPLLLAAVLE